MKKSTLEKVISLWKKGYSIRTENFGMGNGGTETWTPTVEEGEITNVRVYGCGPGWCDRAPTDMSPEKAIAAMEQVPKHEIVDDFLL